MITPKRICTNPECGKVYDNANVTLCPSCGWVTRANIVTKGQRSAHKLGSRLESDGGKRSRVLDTPKESKGGAAPEWGIDVDGEPDSGTPDNG